MSSSGPPSAGNHADRAQSALSAFKEWSNYLLVTTVASIGWIASKNVSFTNTNLQAASLLTLGLSTVFGILTLALIPLLVQQIEPEDVSIYKVKVNVGLLGFECGFYLTQACRPQHILFIIGIAIYCVGTTPSERLETWIIVVCSVLVAALLVVLSTPEIHKSARDRVGRILP
jgi:hypothetical protein